VNRQKHQRLTLTKPQGFLYEFLWSVHPLRALGEAWLLGAFLFFMLARIVNVASTLVLSNGLLFLCAACGTWVALRARLVTGRFVWQAIGETALGFLVSVLMVVGLFLPAHYLLHWDEIWLKSALELKSILDHAGFTMLIMALTGPGCVLVRIGARVWLFWEHLRRRRMLWALTHAHLTVVVAVVILGAGLLFMFWLFGGYISSDTESSPVTAFFFEQFLHAFFPVLAIGIISLIMLLIGVLPPSLLVSFLIARKTTKRLERLASATGKLRDGDYTTRVAVDGEDEVAQLQSTFNTMAGDLERTLRDLQTERDRVAALLQSRRELVASVSHELRTPVATMRGYLNSIQNRAETNLPASVQHDLTVMEREIVRLQGLIDDLFTVSRAEAGGLSLNMTTVDVGSVVRRRVEALSPLARQREHVEVVADVPVDLPPARADAERLDQVLINLLRNALRHTPPGGIVAVVTSTDEAHIRIEVCDTGAGIPQAELPHVWERFYRGDDARELDTQGAGLGLALVKDLVEAMGGQVAAESHTGEGSCFSVWLPCS
jgi:signal transduction histidine kinase